MAEYFGEYGGVVKREFKGDGKKFVKGATLSRDDVIHWPLANRMALHKDGKIDWYGPPVEAENKVRNAGAPAPARGKPKPAPEKAATKESAQPTDKPVTPRRTNRARK